VTALGQQQDIPPSLLTLNQYIQTLDHTLADTTRLKSEPQTFNYVIGSLPPSWQVEVGGKTFTISTSTIRDELQSWKNKPEEVTLDRAVQYLELLREQASTWEQQQPDFAMQHAALNRILARREFRNVHGENWIDRFKQRIKEWLERFLGRVISTSAIPAISDVVVYGLIVIAVFTLAFWMYCSLRDEARVETLMPAGVPVSAKEWPLWVADARGAAARGDWANAVHLAYWAGISFLEAQGLWPADVARTPREYLSLLPASSQQQPTLRSMTFRLESVWYAMLPADEGAFRQILTELESLGCPCN
jgi:hypothetical protein